MTINELTMPKKGKYVYALFRIIPPILERFSSDLAEKYGDKELLELHIFDENMEFRAWISQGEPKTATIDDSLSIYYDDEKMLLENEYVIDGNDKIIVRNYYGYDEKDLLYLKGYRFIDIVR